MGRGRLWWLAAAALTGLVIGWAGTSGRLWSARPDPGSLPSAPDPALLRAQREGKEGPPAQPPKPKEPVIRTPYEKVPEVVLEDAGKIALADAAVKANNTGIKVEPSLPFQRYFWVTSKDEWVEDFLVSFCLHWNLLGDQRVIRWPVLIAPDIVRIDLRWYGFHLNNKLAVYERTAEKDPYFHQKAIVRVKGNVEKEVEIDQHWPGGRISETAKDYERGIYPIKRKVGDIIDEPAARLRPNDARKGKEVSAPIDELRKLLYTESPILVAEWLFVQSARQTSLTNDEKPGIGYYDFRGLKNRDDFFKLTGTDPKVAKQVLSQHNAVIVKSGISRQSRLAFALGSHTQRVWGTQDTNTQKDRGVIRRNLRDGEYDADAEEWFGFNPNRLPLVALIQSKDNAALGTKAGDVAASAPDKIGPDDSPLNTSRDPRVHVGLSCWRCHANDKDLLKPLKDWARSTFREGGRLKLNDPDFKVQLELEALYLGEIDKLLEQDRALYVEAVANATRSKRHPKGLSPAAAFKMYCEAWTRYADTDLTLEDAARELGSDPKALTKAIAAYLSEPNRGQGDNVLASFLDDPPQTIDRLDWEDSYALASALAAGIQPPERVEKLKVKPALETKSDTNKAGGKGK